MTLARPTAVRGSTTNLLHGANRLISMLLLEIISHRLRWLEWISPTPPPAGHRERTKGRSDRVCRWPSRASGRRRTWTHWTISRFPPLAPPRPRWQAGSFTGVLQTPATACRCARCAEECAADCAGQRIVQTILERLSDQEIRGRARRSCPLGKRGLQPFSRRFSLFVGRIDFFSHIYYRVVGYFRFSFFFSLQTFLCFEFSTAIFSSFSS